MSALPTVYLARHGETEWSRSGQHTGRTDLPLLPSGIESAKLLAPRLAVIPFTRVLSSPLSRAKHTAELAVLSSQIDKQELRRFYFAVGSVLSGQAGSGDEGTDVRAVQARLKQIDWYFGDVTGSYVSGFSALIGFA